MNRKALFFFFLLLGGFFSGLAQQSDRLLVFALSNAEAERLYSEAADPDSTLFHTPLDTLSRHSAEEWTPAPGHYLLVSARGEDLALELHSRHSFSVVLLEDPRDLALRVIDAAGQPIREGEVYIRKRKAPFDAATDSYRLQKWHRDGLLRVRVGKEEAFFQLENEAEGTLCGRRLRRFGNTTVGGIVTLPVRLPIGIYRYLQRGIRYGQWGLGWFRGRNKRLNGYVAFSQPRYRPGDTLRVKAHVTRPDGKPWRRPLEVVFFENYRQPILRETVELSDLGGVTYETVLGDSLTLDRTYRVQFEAPGRKRLPGLSHAFRLEDYELDEADFELSIDREEYWRGQPVTVTAEATDKNGLTLPGSFVRLTLLTRNALDFYGEEVWVPDTLWIHRQELEARGPTEIVLPDSIFPAADLRLTLEGHLTSSGGEQQTVTKTFEYEWPAEHLWLHLEGDSLQAEQLEMGRSRQGRAVLYRVGADPSFTEVDTVTLPHREPVNPYVKWYRLTAESTETSLEMRSRYGSPAFSAGVAVSGLNRADSVWVRTENPRRLPLSYRVLRDKVEVTRGETSDSLLIWRHYDPGAATYRVAVQYVWGGRPERVEEVLPFYKKVLDVAVEPPARVLPGETAEVTVRVRDARDRPAANVDLAVGAVNAQFGQAPFRAPGIRYREGREPLVFNEFQLEAWRGKSWREPLDPTWVEPLALDTILFYQLRFPEAGVLLHYDTLPAGDSLPQFAPYLIEEGREQSIELIYCNRELVYFAPAGQYQPYSFVGRPGYNQLVLRTQRYEYTLDSVYLQPGHKLELALDVHRRLSQRSLRIDRRPMPRQLTERELGFVGRHTLELRPDRTDIDYFLWQEGRPPHRVRHQRGYGDLPVGPFRKDLPLQVLSVGAFYTQFPFEPGYAYEIEARRERLYASDRYHWDREYLLPGNRPYHLPGQRALPPVDTAEWLRPVPAPDFVLRTSRDRDHRAAYRFDFRADTTFLYATVLVRDTQQWAFGPLQRRLDYLPAGHYELYLFTDDGRYHRRTLPLRSDTLLYQDLSRVGFSKDENRELIRRLLFQKQTLPDWEEIQLERRRGFSGPVSGTLSGRVVDEDGEPLIGASVLVKGTTVGTVTDLDGAFELNVPAGGREVVVSYVGFTTQEVDLSVRRAGRLNVVMGADGLELSEVIVTGFAFGTGDFRNRGRSSMEVEVSPDALQGRAAGLSVRGSRDRATDYYVDGVRIGGEPVPEVDSDWQAAGGLRTQFRDYAFWQPSVLTDRNGEARFSVTFPDDITRWRTFAVGMDHRGRAGTALADTRAYQPVQAQLDLPRFLLAGDRTVLTGRAANFTADTLAVRTYFQQDKATVAESRYTLIDGQVDSAAVQAPAGVDSLTFTYALEMEGYTDGERRQIPVFPVGSEETAGYFALLEGDTTFQLEFDPRLGPVAVIARTNALDLMLEDIQYLKNYPYGCNEQTASRLLALLLEKEICRETGRSFEGEGEITKAVVRLRKAQNADGAWGWWPEGEAGAWMTVYVLRALQRAGTKGYETRAYELGLRYLTGRLPALSGRDRLHALDLLAEAGQNLDYDSYLSAFDTTGLSVHDRLLTLAIRQSAGLAWSRDTLARYRRSTALGGDYWGAEGYDIFGGHVQSTLLAYRLLRRAGEGEALARIRHYFLEKRSFATADGRRGGWRNTFETAQILAAILPDLPAEWKEATGPGARLWLNGKEAPEDPFPIFPGEGTGLQVRKAGPAPLYFTAYQQFFNPKPEPREDWVKVTTRLEQDGRPVTILERGKPARLVMELEVKAAADYVMIEAPIPAGCSYGNKAFSRFGPEVHREYFRQHTAIFCERLPVGRYTFTIELEPRFSGIYTLNPARVEEMYVPVFFGRNGMKGVEVE